MNLTHKAKRSWKDAPILTPIVFCMIFVMLFATTGMIDMLVPPTPQQVLAKNTSESYIEVQSVFSEINDVKYIPEEPEFNANITEEIIPEDPYVQVYAGESYNDAYYRTYGCTPEQRRIVESSDNYAYYDGVYVGAYNFDERYMAERMQNWGLGEYDRDAFLADPALQDAAADAYANDRYGGWENVPSTGGW